MLVCCIYVGLMTFVTVFMLFFSQLYQSRDGRSKKVRCGRMICFLNKHELQLSDWKFYFLD